MYVTTFYSFKGGVGRTMALVNTAVDLALRGRRVLVVDFDIEAPGIDTFDALRSQGDVPGLIDFVAEYMRTGVAPDVSDYVGDCPQIGTQGGKLWVMPSGRVGTYTATLGQVNWLDLYERHDGYILLEDLKHQWKQALHPDYVLIDSRTGHTDSSGICTRQLPDSVVILFFPNEQNLRGLVQVVGDIRAEGKEPRNKDIVLHFVMSNVPDLDDEDQILQDKILEFRQKLGFRRDLMVVHRYDSLSLLNQVVFVKDRPRSRLAHEYNQIAKEISIGNWNDRDGVLEYIKRVRERGPWFENEFPFTRDERLENIEKVHRNDGEVLFHLSKIVDWSRSPEWSAHLVDQAIHCGYRRPEAFLARSRFRTDNQDLEGAAEDAWSVLDSDRIAPPMVREAIRCLVRLWKHDLERLVASNAVRSLEPDGKSWLAGTFNRSQEELSVAIIIFEDVLFSPDDINSRARDRARHGLGLSLMGLGRCAEAAGCFRQPNCAVSDMGIVEAFNYGMAVWGTGGIIEREAFERTVEIDAADEDPEKGANYLQCMALAYWAVADVDRALDRLNDAQRSAAALRGRSEFSCWRYLQVNKSVFETDLEEMRAMIEGDEVRSPLFMKVAEERADG